MNDDNAVLWGLRDRCSVLGKSLRYFTSFDFGTIDVEIPCSDSTHAAWAYTTLPRHVENTVSAMRSQYSLLLYMIRLVGWL